LPAAASIDQSLFVLADQQRFKQVLLNVLTNAVKYTPVSGRVIVSCEAYGNDRVRIFVKDTGPGIAEEKLNLLFLPFERLGAEGSKVEGTGLGLAVSQRLMQVMGGSIGVQSKVGEGSNFWLEFPRAKTPSVQRAPQPEMAQRNEERPVSPDRKILYIEDNPSNLTLVEQLLEERPEIELLPATAGELGLVLAREHSPDLILLDVHLPDLDGCTILSRLKASEATRDIPVVVVSADATTRQMDRLMNAGASTYLTKPFDVSKLFQVLDKATRVDIHSTRDEASTEVELKA
jgi:CheY-like chemotaxis protein